MAKKQRTSETAVDTAEPKDGLCYFCHKPTGPESFCFGCDQFVCEGCELNDNMPLGGHSVHVHRDQGVEL